MIKLILVTGKRAQGKTWLTKKAYLNDRDNTCNILVIDAFDEYKDIEGIKLNEISEFCKNENPSIKRLNATVNMKDATKLFLKVLKEFTKGIIIGDAFVDMMRSNEIDQEIWKMMLCSHGTKSDLEIILHFHDYKSIPRKWLTLPEGLRLHQEM